mgnify:CR=1 FL=1
MMNHQINIGFETEVADENSVRELIRTCAERVLASEQVDFDAEIDVTVVHGYHRRRNITRSILGQNFHYVLKINKRMVGSASSRKAYIFYAFFLHGGS